MGIIYKLMKQRNLTMNLNKNVKNTKNKSDRNRLITIEGDIIEGSASKSPETVEEDLTENMETTMDREFTAEHIMQLCRFLAEKSKRNKNLYKQQQSPKKLTKSKQSEFPFQTTEYIDNEVEVDFYQNEALPLLSQQRLKLQGNQHLENGLENEKVNYLEQQNTSEVLTTRLSPDINSLNISSSTSIVNTCALQHYQQQSQHIFSHHHQQRHQTQFSENQSKRDILLKIRRQIFERKRLRENATYEPEAFNSSAVWRPW